MTTRVRALLPAAEAALVLLTLATVASLYRLFNHGSFFPQLAAVALVAHGAAIVARRRGWSLPVAALVSLVVMVMTIAVVLYGDTTTAGIPTAATFDAARTDLTNVWHMFETVQAPTPVVTPFLLLAALGLWWAAFVADWAAFRLWVPFEAVLPAGTVFVFASLFASQRGQIGASALFLAGAFTFLLVHRVTKQQSSGGWVSSDVQRGTNALLRAGAVLGVLAVVVAVVVGPNLPQARSQALVGWRNGTGEGPSSRTTISPLVQIQQRLVDQSNLEMFTVQSDQRAYWRLTALDQFDGNVWSSNGSYEAAKGSLPRGVSSDAQKLVVHQRYDVTALDTIWLPAAFEPRAVDAGNTAVRFEPGMSTLIVGTSFPNSNGAVYTVDSELPVFDPAELTAPSSSAPPDLVAQETQLPPTVSARVREEAARVVAGATTPYQQALALQNYFRDNFTYDLNVPPGHSEDAMENFLFETRRGYCEQFAGTYAAMARAVGLPTRVGVGFTPGDEDPAHPGLYHVKGLHAHAWPEVYIAGKGWVIFDPTPGRAPPHAQQYTGLVEEQATDNGTTETVPTTAAVAPTASQGTTTTTAPARTNATSAPSAAAKEPSFWSTSRFGGRFLVGSGVLVALAAAYLAVVPLLGAAHRRRRRQRAVEPGDRVRLAWQESIEATQLVGVAPARAETPAEFGRRAKDAIGADEFPRLAALVTEADYSPAGVDEAGAQQALAISDGVTSSVRARSTRQQRWRAALDPRPPDRRRPVTPRRSVRRRRATLPSIEVVQD